MLNIMKFHNRTIKWDFMMTDFPHFLSKLYDSIIFSWNTCLVVPCAPAGWVHVRFVFQRDRLLNYGFRPCIVLSVQNIFCAIHTSYTPKLHDDNKKSNVNLLTALKSRPLPVRWKSPHIIMCTQLAMSPRCTMYISGRSLGWLRTIPECHRRPGPLY